MNLCSPARAPNPSGCVGFSPYILCAGLFAAKHTSGGAAAGGGSGGGSSGGQNRGVFLNGVMPLKGIAAATAATDVAAGATYGGGAFETAKKTNAEAALSNTAAEVAGGASGVEQTTKPLGFYFKQHAAAGSKHTAHWEAVARIRGALLGEDKGNGTHPLGFYFGLSAKDGAQLEAVGATATATPAQPGLQRRRRRRLARAL